MIIDLLFISLVIGTIIVYFLKNKILLSPILIVFAGFTLSVFSIVINKSFFNADISFVTYLVIMTSLLAWGVGEMLSKTLYANVKMPILSFSPTYKILPSNRILFFSCLIIFTVSVSEYFRFINIGSSLGGDNFAMHYFLVRQYVVEGQNTGQQSDVFAATKTVVALITLARTITYFFIVLFFYNKYFHGINKNKYLIPIVIYFPIIFFTTSRSTFLELFSFVFFIFLLLRYQSKGWSIGSFKILIRMILPLLIILISFYLVGFIRSNGIGSVNFVDMFNSLSKYLGSSIIGLDIFISSGFTHSENFAQQTFPILYVFLEKFGLNFEIPPLHSEFFSIGNGVDTSNVYTGLRKPIIDFGILGMIFSRVFMGLIYGLIFRYFSNNINNPLSITSYVLFPLFYFPLLMYCFSNLFYYFFQIAFIETLLILFFVKKWIVNKSLVIKN